MARCTPTAAKPSNAWTFAVLPSQAKPTDCFGSDVYTYGRGRAPGADDDGSALLERRGGDGTQRADPGDTARRGPGSRGTQRRSARRYTERPGRAAEQEPHSGAGIRAAGGRRGRQDVRVHRPVSR